MAAHPGVPMFAAQPDIATTSTGYLAAVGIPAGIQHAPSAAPIGMVRAGAQDRELSEVEYQLWLLGLQPRPRADLLSAAVDAGVPATAATLEALLHREALVAFTGTLAVDRSQLARLRFQLCATGLGNTAEQPARFQLGARTGEPWMESGPSLYALLLLSTGGDSLWALCDQLATLAELDAEQVAMPLIATLPLIVGSGTAYLDSMP